MANRFVPSEHPRDPFGRFLAVVRGLKVGDTHTIKTPDGHADISVSAVANGGKREFHVREGDKVTRHAQSAAATRHALSISAAQQHSEALGGEDPYNDLAHYQDVNGPGSDPAAKTRAGGGKPKVPRVPGASKRVLEKSGAKALADMLNMRSAAKGNPRVKPEPRKVSGVKFENARGSHDTYYADVTINGRRRGRINGYKEFKTKEIMYHGVIDGQDFHSNSIRELQAKVQSHFQNVIQAGAPDIREMDLHDLKKERNRLLSEGKDVAVHDAEISRRRAGNAEVPEDVVKAFMNAQDADGLASSRVIEFSSPYHGNLRGDLPNYRYDWRAKLKGLGLDPEKVIAGGKDYMDKLNAERKDAHDNLKEAQRDLYIELILRNQAFEVKDHGDRLNHKPFEIKVKQGMGPGGIGWSQFVSANGAHIHLSRFATRDAADKALAKINAKEILRLMHEKNPEQ